MAVITTTKLMALSMMIAGRAANPNSPISRGRRNSAPPRPIIPSVMRALEELRVAGERGGGSRAPRADIPLVSRKGVRSRRPCMQKAPELRNRPGAFCVAQWLAFSRSSSVVVTGAMRSSKNHEERPARAR